MFAMFTRKQFLECLAASFATLPIAAAADTAPPKAAVRKIRGAVDHAKPGVPHFYLDCLIFDDKIEPKWPTVFVIGDGQQFYVVPEQMPKLRPLFGDNVNIIGIAGRGFSQPLLNRLGDPNSANADWLTGYQLLQDRQWTGDIDAARVQLLGRDAKINIFGVSGGGFLVHAYMIRYGRNVRAAYSEVFPLPPIERSLGLQHDKFWQELDDADRNALRQALATHPENRRLSANLFHRQTSFVDLNALAAARRDLIATIARDDLKALDKLSADYQVDALAQMAKTSAAWPIRVREYEFIQPVLAAG